MSPPPKAALMDGYPCTICGAVWPTPGLAIFHEDVHNPPHERERDLEEVYAAADEVEHRLIAETRERLATKAERLELVSSTAPETVTVTAPRTWFVSVKAITRMFNRR